MCDMHNSDTITGISALWGQGHINLGHWYPQHLALGLGPDKVLNKHVLTEEIHRH